MKKNLVLVIFALLGVATTAYLSFEHFRGVNPVCPLFGPEGCAVAASSIYSVLFGIPVAYLGLLAWLAILYYSHRHYKHGKDILPVVVISGIGVAAAGYFNAIMLYRLGQVCFWCETSHALMIATFLYSVHLAHSHQKGWLWKSVAVACALFFVPFLLTARGSADPAALSLATCLTEKNVTMYGAFWCPHCKEQKDLFGPAFENVNYVECSLPDRSAQTEICDNMNITGYPTWIRSDGERKSGTQALNGLKQWTGC